MFESLNVPGTALIPDSALALYSYGKTTGLVLDSGYDHTRAVPVYEGYPMTHAMCNVPVGGRQVTERLGHVLKVRFCANIRTRRDWDAVKEIKKDCCYVAQDYDQEMAAYEDDTEGRKGFKKKSVLCKLPDGTTVDIGCEAFRCVEPLFRPGAFGVPSARHGGIGDAVRDAIDACRPGVRDVMYDNIVLAGGCAATPSLADRLGRELYRPHRPAVVDAPVGRKYATWLGGSVLASAVGVDQLLIDRGEYEEFGVDVVRRKTVF